jgi:hypothetical protein
LADTIVGRICPLSSLGEERRLYWAHRRRGFCMTRAKVHDRYPPQEQPKSPPRSNIERHVGAPTIADRILALQKAAGNQATMRALDEGIPEGRVRELRAKFGGGVEPRATRETQDEKEQTATETEEPGLDDVANKDPSAAIQLALSNKWEATGSASGSQPLDIALLYKSVDLRHDGGESLEGQTEEGAPFDPYKEGAESAFRGEGGESLEGETEEGAPFDPYKDGAPSVFLGEEASVSPPASPPLARGRFKSKKNYATIDLQPGLQDENTSSWKLTRGLFKDIGSDASGVDTNQALRSEPVGTTRGPWTVAEETIPSGATIQILELRWKAQRKPERYQTEISALLKKLWGWSDADVDQFYRLNREHRKAATIDQREQIAGTWKVDYGPDHPDPDVRKRWLKQFAVVPGPVFTVGDPPRAFDTMGLVSKFSGRDYGIFVMDRRGRIYVGQHKVGLFHHSSFLAGAGVAAAGEMKVMPGGRLVAVTGKSGHYMPGPDQMTAMLERLAENHVPLDGVDCVVWVGRNTRNLYDAAAFLKDGTAAPVKT